MSRPGVARRAARCRRRTHRGGARPARCHRPAPPASREPRSRSGWGQPTRRAPVPSTVELTAVVPAFSRDGDTPTSVHPAGHRLDCRPRGLQADGSGGRPPATAVPNPDGRAHQRSRDCGGASSPRLPPAGAAMSADRPARAAVIGSNPGTGGSAGGDLGAFAGRLGMGRLACGHEAPPTRPGFCSPTWHYAMIALAVSICACPRVHLTADQRQRNAPRTWKDRPCTCAKTGQDASF